MDETSHADLSFDRTPSVWGSEEGYSLWFSLPPRSGDATTPELQTLCQGSILLGRIAHRMDWDWPTLIRNIDHLSAPSDGFLLIEVGSRLFNSERFRRALQESVPESGLDAHKVKLVDEDNANDYILAFGLPSI